MLIFSEDWAAAYIDAINANEEYAKSSKNWELGAIALVIKQDGGERAVIVDLLHGKCLKSTSITMTEAHEQATFVVEGDEAAWKQVLAGEIQPLMAIMRGKLKLGKGSIAKLLPYTKGAIELVHSAQTLDTEF